jgi:4-amino-4-deoxy-L-arabinose transferase-like glycosyltransferase
MWQQFWGDQMGRQVVLDVSSRWKDIFRYSSYYLIQFLPWLLFLPELLVRNWRTFRSRSVDQRCADRMTLGWLVVIGIVFGLSRNLSDRYTLSVAPLAAVTLAGLFHLADPGKRQPQMGQGLKVVLVLLILASTVAAWITFSLDQTLLAIGVLAFGLGVAAVLWFASRNERLIPRGVAIGLGILAIAPVACLAAGQVALPDQGEQIATILRQHQLLEGQSNHQPIVMIGKGGLAAKIRVFTSGGVLLQRYLDLDSPGAREAVRSAEWILGTEKNLEGLDLSGWHRLEATRVFAKMSADDIFRAVGQGTLGDLLRLRQTEMILVRRGLLVDQP